MCFKVVITTFLDTDHVESKWPNSFMQEKMKKLTRFSILGPVGGIKGHMQHLTPISLNNFYSYKIFAPVEVRIRA